MGRTLFFVAAFLGMATTLSSQTERPGVVLNADSCYLYAVDLPINSSSTVLAEGSMLHTFSWYVEPNAHGEIDMSAKYLDQEGTVVYGIAVVSSEPLLENMYLDVSVINSDQMVVRLRSTSADTYTMGSYRYEANVPQYGVDISEVRTSYNTISKDRFVLKRMNSTLE